jgi:hypothetical protein
MFTMWAVLVYLLALAIPLYLLWQFDARHWLWHVLAIVAALALGFVPPPFGLISAAVDLAFGFAFIFLTIWGIGGLILTGRHHEPGHHRERHA